MVATVEELTARGLQAGDTQRVEMTGPKGAAVEVVTYWISDPDGNRIELLQLKPDPIVSLTGAYTMP